MHFQPYPANPSFKPPPPLSDALRSEIYKSFMDNPKENNVRELSARYNLSLKRVEAILRLKGLEAHWIQVRVAQCFWRGFPSRREEFMMLRNTISLEDTYMVTLFSCLKSISLHFLCFSV